MLRLIGFGGAIIVLEWGYWWFAPEGGAIFAVLVALAGVVISLRGRRLHGIFVLLLPLASVITFLFGSVLLLTPQDVAGRSMSPTLGAGDRVLVADNQTLKLGDIVLLRDMGAAPDALARVVGTAGDRIGFYQGHVIRNGAPIR